MIVASQYSIPVLKVLVLPETPQPNVLYIFPTGKMAATDAHGVPVPIVGETRVFEQMVPATCKRCCHNLNGYPSVELVDTAGTVWGGVDVHYLDRDTLEVRVTHPMTFTVNLN